MAHLVAEEVDVELDDIWLYIARQSGSIEIADKIRRLDGVLAPGLRSFPVGNYVLIYCIENEDGRYFMFSTAAATSSGVFAIKVTLRR